MELADVRRILSQCRDELDGMGVLSLSVFGSVARGEERPDSGVDLLADLRDDLSLHDVTGLKLHLEQMLGCAVDLVERSTLKPRVREEVLREAVSAR